MNTALLSLALIAAPLVQTPAAGSSAPESSEAASAAEAQVDAEPPAQAEPAVEPAAPPMTQPADEPTASHPHDNRELTEAPRIGVEGQAVPMHGPRLGMTLRGASIGPDGTYVHADARSWGELVHNDPELSEMYRLSKLREPGIVLTTLFGTWAALSITISADLGQPQSHTGRFFAYGLPAIGLAAGIPMTIVGVKNRRKLHRAHMRMAAAPVVTPDGAMLGVVGRF